jgi:hypothetical protein
VPRLIPLLDDPFDEEPERFLVDPLVEPPVDGLVTVEGWVASGAVVVELVVVDASVFGVPAYVSAASHPNPAVATSPTTAAAAVISERRRVASERR